MLDMYILVQYFSYHFYPIKRLPFLILRKLLMFNIFVQTKFYF